MLNVFEMQTQFANAWMRMAETGARAMSDACLKAGQDATQAVMGATTALTGAQSIAPRWDVWPMVPQARMPMPFDMTFGTAPFGLQSFWPAPQPWGTGFGFANVWNPLGLSPFPILAQPKPLASQLVDIAFANYRSASGHAVAALSRPMVPMVPMPNLTMPWCAGPGAITWRSLLN